MAWTAARRGTHRATPPTWSYRLCDPCALRYDADDPRCPRCGTVSAGPSLPAYAFAGFLARPDERPILDEEERYAVRNLVAVYPQWNGEVVGRWTVGHGWALRLSRHEDVRWINEGLRISASPGAAGPPPGGPQLHAAARGWLLCPTCGHQLDPPAPVQTSRGGRRTVARSGGVPQTGGHADDCPHRGTSPQPVAITTAARVEVLRLLVPVPRTPEPERYFSWGPSLGYALLNGMQHHGMLDTSELEFELEGPWHTDTLGAHAATLSLAFIDPSLGGSDYLERLAEQFHLVAGRALEHLEHPNCDTACYRCLKVYQNQRYHEQLAWPQTLPALDGLAQTLPVQRPLETGDLDDPRPWLEAYAAGVGSPLELAFLRLFEQHGFHPQKQVPVAPHDGERPISVADFAVPARRLAIYIDSAAFHVGQHLRRDRFIRDRLRQGTPPWRVEELRAADVQQGVALVARLVREGGA